jgi:hypothetical protein
MVALQLSTSANLGYLCVAAGFLVIVASVVFVIKGKAVLSEAGAPNVVEWGKIKANLTSAVALFVLGGAMILLPFWRFQQAAAAQQAELDSQPPAAILTGNITGPGGKDLRLLLVVKPDYDMTYDGDVNSDVTLQVPLVAGKVSYSLIYTQDNAIIHEQPFSVGSAVPGSLPQTITLPKLDLQSSVLPAQPISLQNITPQLDISNEEVSKSLSVH